MRPYPEERIMIGYEELLKLVGHRIIRVEKVMEYDREFQYIYFDNGKILTCEDGEFNYSVFQFVNKNEKIL